MLKHISSATGSGGGASSSIGGHSNGQLRNNPTVAARSIHLRPPQPLNISTLSALNASTLQSSATSTATTAPPTTLPPSTANGGGRIPHPHTTLLNIAANSPTNLTAGISSGAAGTATTAQTTPVTPITPITPITPLTPNGIGHNLHTYTNQHIPATNNNINNTTALTLNTTHNNTNNNNNTILNKTNATNQHNYSNCTNLTGKIVKQSKKHGPGPREALTSLGLLCLVSLLLALLSLIFLLKISPNAREEAVNRSQTEDFVIIYDVTLALCALSLSLNLCCLLVCAIQFLFAVKLVRSPMFDGRDNKYLEKSSASRTCAVGGFFISIPIFLTGIILYTFNHFHSTPAIITSILIGIGIVFCGGAMVHNVFIWQREKTISYRSPPMNLNLSCISQPHIGPITPVPPLQFINHHQQPLNLHQHHLHPHQHPHHLRTYNQTPTNPLFHPQSLTPVSPNHSHGSFNPLVTHSGLNSSFLMRPATATPPTPKQLANGCLTLNAREPSGSVSPTLPGVLDMSNITSPSLHELSTLV